MESVESKVNVLEVRMDNQDKEINNLKQETKAIPRLETLMEIVVETNKEQTETLKSINENMTGLNNKLEHVDRRVEKLEQYSQEDSENSKVDLNKLTKHVIFYTVAIVVGALVMKWVGLN